MLACGLAVQPVGHKDKCQFQVTLVNGSETCAVLIRISHLVVDGGDGKYLLNKLAEAYQIEEENRDIGELVVKDGSRSAMNAYKDLGLREMKSLFKMPFSGVKTIYPFP